MFFALMVLPIFLVIIYLKSYNLVLTALIHFFSNRKLGVPHDYCLWFSWFLTFFCLILQCHRVLWRHFDRPAVAGVLFADGSCKMVTGGTGTRATPFFHSRWCSQGCRCRGAGWYTSQSFARRKKFSFYHVQRRLYISKELKRRSGKPG